MKSKEKLVALQREIQGYDRVAVAYSGGVDSTFLLHVAAKLLPPEKVCGVIVVSSITPPWDLGFAERFCDKQEITLLRIEAPEKIDDPAFKENTPERCYICKIFNGHAIQRELGAGWNILSGANASDRGDVRPGLKADRELNIKTPLMDLGITKEEIRLLSKEMDLSGWDRPSSACLASRITFGIPIVDDLLHRISEAELYLRSLDFSVVRVRAYPLGTAKIETLPEDLTRLLEHRESIVEKLLALGFNSVTLDMEGYIPAGVRFARSSDASTG